MGTPRRTRNLTIYHVCLDCANFLRALARKGPFYFREDGWETSATLVAEEDWRALAVLNLGGSHLVIVSVRANKDYIRVLLYSYYTAITWWGVFLALAI